MKEGKAKSSIFMTFMNYKHKDFHTKKRTDFYVCSVWVNVFVCLSWSLFILFFEGGSPNWTQNLLTQQAQLANSLQGSHLCLLRLNIWEGHHAHATFSWVLGNQALVQIPLSGRCFSHRAISLDLVGYVSNQLRLIADKRFIVRCKTEHTFLEKE